MALSAVYCSFRFSSAFRQQRAVSELRADGVPVELKYNARNSTWLESIFGETMFGNVGYVCLSKDEQVKRLGALRGTPRLVLWGSGITDESIEQLIALNALKRIELSHTCVSKEGISRLRQSLPKCEIVIYPPSH